MNKPEETILTQKSILLSKDDSILKGVISLPGSKSISNRALILQALSNNHFNIHELSEAKDSSVLKNILSEDIHQGAVDVGPAGTTMRFLTAYFSIKENVDIILTGSARMQERPIRILTDALGELGADIAFENKSGFPPLRIKGKKLNKTKQISIPGNISSQYISALLLIAPLLPDGLIIDLKGEITSEPYISMTLSLMEYMGIHFERKEQNITIPSQEINGRDIYIEPDWSSASYWYGMAACAQEADLLLKGLKKESLQGDAAIAEIMKDFGVETIFSKDGARLIKSGESKENIHIDFKNCPDLAQTVIVCSALLGKNISVSGLETLKIKETDRVLALQQELSKLGIVFFQKAENYFLDTKDKNFSTSSPVYIKTYEDHRMAMSFAMLALKGIEVEMENPQVVEKSYPGFWNDLKKCGFKIY